MSPVKGRKFFSIQNYYKYELQDTKHKNTNHSQQVCTYILYVQQTEKAPGRRANTGQGAHGSVSLKDERAAARKGQHLPTTHIYPSIYFHSRKQQQPATYDTPLQSRSLAEAVGAEPEDIPNPYRRQRRRRSIGEYK